MTAEQVRLDEARAKKVPWKKWGPYLSERQWGTVREDYSEGGNAWDYFSHDQARSRAYRWGEDGLAGISDDKQRLCFALALWNGKDPILKERLFGLTNSEGNHGEDVKEYYFYLDSTPTHSYMKYLYKYPQAAFPYGNLVETSRGRGRHRIRVRTARHRRLRREPLLRRLRGIRQGDARRHPDPDHASTTAGRSARRVARAADALVPQPVVLAGNRRAGRRCSRSSAVAGRASSRRSIPCSASATSTATAKRRCCSRRTRPTPSASSACPTGPRTSRTASTTASSTAEPKPSTRSRKAPRRRPIIA